MNALAPKLTWTISPSTFGAACLCVSLLGCTGAEKKGPPDRSEAESSVRGEVLQIDEVSWPLMASVQGSLFPDEVTVVSARVSGRVAEISCDLGDPVHLGGEILLLDDREYSLRVVQSEALLSQARVAVGLKSGEPADSLDPMNAPPVREARAVLDEAKQKIDRLQRLHKQGTVVATDVETAELDERVAEARFNSATNSVREKIAMIAVQSAQLDLAQQQLSDAHVLAPLEGMVQRRMVSVGTYVQAGEPLFEIARTNVLRYRATVPERLAQRVAVGQSLTLMVEGNEFQVSVSRISPSLDPMSRSLVFEAKVPNEGNRLRSGLFAQAELVLDQQSVAIAIPQTALVRFAGVDKVWKVADGSVSESVVAIGQERDDLIEILSGLEVGDRILIDGKQGRVGKYDGSTAQPMDGPSVATSSPQVKGT